MASGTTMASFRPDLMIRLVSSWDHIAVLREYVGAWVKTRARQHTDRVQLVVQELLENAVKYGDPSGEIELEMQVTRSQVVEVRVTNRALPARIAVLEREFARQQRGTAQEAFARALERLNRLPEGSSMLGLSRVALEAALDVQRRDDVVVVSARIDGTQRPPPRGPSTGSSGTLKLDVDGRRSDPGVNDVDGPSSHTRGGFTRPFEGRAGAVGEHAKKPQSR